MWISEYIYFNFFRKLLILKLFWILFVCSGLLFVSSQSLTSFNISEDVDWNDAILVFLYNTQHLKVGLKHLFLIVLSHLWGVVLSYMTSRKNVILYSFIFRHSFWKFSNSFSMKHYSSFDCLSKKVSFANFVSAFPFFLWDFSRANDIKKPKQTPPYQSSNPSLNFLPLEKLIDLIAKFHIRKLKIDFSIFDLVK